MLVEAEPENKAFQDNVGDSRYYGYRGWRPGGMMEAPVGMLTPENMEKMNQMAAPMMGLFNPEIAEKLKNALISPSAISTLQPYFGGPQIWFRDDVVSNGCYVPGNDNDNDFVVSSPDWSRGWGRIKNEL